MEGFLKERCFEQIFPPATNADIAVPRFYRRDVKKLFFRDAAETPFAGSGGGGQLTTSQ